GLERAVGGRVPGAARDDQRNPGRHLVHGREDCVAPGHRERSARAEVNLRIHDQQRARRAWIFSHRGYYSPHPMDMTQPVLLTREGLERLKKELVLVRARRVEAADRMKEASQPGDIEDNPEYEQAKEEVGLLDGRIYELQEMIGRAQIIRDTHSSVAGPGSTIEVVDNEGASETYHLVGAVESDPSAGRIS